MTAWARLSIQEVSSGVLALSNSSAFPQPRQHTSDLFFRQPCRACGNHNACHLHDTLLPKSPSSLASFSKQVSSGPFLPQLSCQGLPFQGNTASSILGVPVRCAPPAMQSWPLFQGTGPSRHVKHCPRCTSSGTHRPIYPAKDCNPRRWAIARVQKLPMNPSYKRWILASFCSNDVRSTHDPCPPIQACLAQC